MDSSGAETYRSWNERIALFWLVKPPADSEAYLTITPRVLSLALWECDGLQVAPEEAESQLITAVRGGYRLWVIGVRKDVGSLACIAAQGEAPLCLAFLAASVLAAHRMRADDGNRANAYYARLAQILDVPQAREGLPQGFSKEGFEALWVFTREWTVAQRLGPLFLPKTEGVVQRYVAYPLAHTELRAVDLKKLPSFFDWAGYAPGAAVALERMREDFVQWYPRNLTAQGRAACADHRLAGVLQQVAQELSAWNGISEDDAGRRVAHVELMLDVIRGTPRLSYLARRAQGFPEVFEHAGHRFDSLEEGWYDPLPVPKEDGEQLLNGFEWSAAADGSTSAFALKRRPAAAIAFVTSEEYSGMTSRRRLLAGVECALLYHESVASTVEARLKQVSDMSLRPVAEPGLPREWRVLLNLRVRPNGESFPHLEALEVDTAVELIMIGGLRLGRRASWLIDCPPRLLVSGLPQSVLVDGRPAKVADGGAVDLTRIGSDPGAHLVEAGRARLRFEIVAGSVAEDLKPLSTTRASATHTLALARGRWLVIGQRPGEIDAFDISTQALLRVSFEPLWAIRRATPGVVLYLASGEKEPGTPTDDANAVLRWASAIQAAAEKNTPLACIDPAVARSVEKQWRAVMRTARRLGAKARGAE